MRLLKRRSRRLVACVYCNNGWRYIANPPGVGAEYVRCWVCGGSGDFVSRRDT